MTQPPARGRPQPNGAAPATRGSGRGGAGRAGSRPRRRHSGGACAEPTVAPPGAVPCRRRSTRPVARCDPRSAAPQPRWHRATRWSRAPGRRRGWSRARTAAWAGMETSAPPVPDDPRSDRRLRALGTAGLGRRASCRRAVASCCRIRALSLADAPDVPGAQGRRKSSTAAPRAALLRAHGRRPTRRGPPRRP